MSCRFFVEVTLFKHRRERIPPPGNVVPGGGERLKVKVVRDRAFVLSGEC